MAQRQTGLFFMTTTPQGAITQFPRQFKGTVFKGLDKPFLFILSACALVLLSIFFVLASRPVTEEVTEKEILRIQERYAQLILNQPKKQVEEAVQKASKPAETATKAEIAEDKTDKKEKVDRKKESVVEKEQRKEASREDRVRKRDAIRQQLQSSGIFAAITSSGSGAGSGGAAPVTDLLGGSLGMGEIGNVDISSGSFATKDVDPVELEQRRGEKTSGVGIEKASVGTASGTELASAGQVNITSEPPVLSGEAAGKGSRTQAAINRVVSQQQSRLKKVYEAMLKRDPSLSGKLVIKFTIQADGTVTDVAIVQSTTNNSTFDKRILSYIARWTFPPVEGGGAVEVVFPFVFTGAA